MTKSNVERLEHYAIISSEHFLTKRKHVLYIAHSTALNFSLVSKGITITRRAYSFQLQTTSYIAAKKMRKYILYTLVQLCYPEAKRQICS